MRKKLNPSFDIPLTLEDSAMADPKIAPDVEQPSLFPELPEDDQVAASGAEVKPPKKAKTKPVVTPDPLPAEKLMEDDVDEFSPENLRLLNKIDLRNLVTAELVELPARKPKKDEWFRVHPDYQQQGGILELDSERKEFWVNTKMQAQVMGDPCFSLRLCVLCVNRHGVPFIWPVKVSGKAGSDKFVKVPLAAMAYGRDKWTRLYWSAEKFEHQVETNELLDVPKFPDRPFPELLRLAFKDAMITTLDHPAFLELKGRAK